MVFKRRDKRPILQIVQEFVWPRGGWARAFYYMRHRVRRLPGSPERIARGLWAGVFSTFTPFYGLHFIVAALLSRAVQGNLLAALLGTFFGNPLSYLPIGVISLKTGHFLLGTEFEQGQERSLVGKFANAGSDLVHNFWAAFTDATMDWHGLSIFWGEVFYPYLIGGILPGIVAATVTYYLSVPVIRAYQKRRAKQIQAKFEALKIKAQQASAHAAEQQEPKK
ncbi:MAG: DUF2062 domain-containing protein [Cognatishimia sp.]|uniref:DUF2062 domain-containing protein n=1 Tax=Cognatishimia sp. 1_MG-2023 TaxID=3062642 RepID=UPI0026E1C924|nr:DUF2062 domain-containing protein [Cognatishimia sp. 1_MG-2023]MDO6728014.1 DUF2062 domain-containing protein [Cognatishimia sp. 1_MG-2023]